MIRAGFYLFIYIYIYIYIFFLFVYFGEMWSLVSRSVLRVDRAVRAHLVDAQLELGRVRGEFSATYGSSLRATMEGRPRSGAR